VAGDDKHGNLLRFYRDMVEAECNGDGWVTVVDAEGVERMGHCPVCQRGRLLSSIADFIPPRFRKPVKLADAVAGWAAKGKEAQGLYLTGQVGTGKTHTAWAAVAAWCETTGTTPHHGGEHDFPYEGQRYGPSVIFTRMTDLLDDLRPGDYARQRVRDCQNARLLVLDDLGAEKASEWTQERLYSIVDDRYANCQALIVTSNLPPGKLSDQTGERTASRLAEMCVVVPITGTDRRKPAA
jgi:DNA replication protein DnaC